MSKTFLQIIIFGFLSALVMWLLWHVLSALYWIGWMILWLGILALLVYVTLSIFKPKLPTFGIKKPVQFILSDAAHGHVYAFRTEPSLKDLAMLNNELHIAKLELQGDLLQIENDTKITIVEDTGNEAVKIKLKDPKAKEKVFWVPRSSIVKKDQPKLLGS